MGSTTGRGIEFGGQSHVPIHPDIGTEREQFGRAMCTAGTAELSVTWSPFGRQLRPCVLQVVSTKWWLTEGFFGLRKRVDLVGGQAR